MIATTCLMVAAASLALLMETATAASRFEIGDEDFRLDGRPFVIKCGEMHFSRIPPEYWQHRLRMCRAMGLNTVCAYLFWNAHEPAPGQFEFTGKNDVALFCRMAQEEGLKVILRPGPYSCAEWEFGGLPWWLLKHHDIKVRTRDDRFLAACRRYLLEVGRQLAPLQCTRGGPVIMVQVENEYGSYGDDREYIGVLRDDLIEAGFEVPMFTSDGPVQLKNDVRDDLFCVVNFGSDPAGAFKQLREIRRTGPLMCGEFYPGWFDSWGKPHHYGQTANVLRDLEWMLARDISFSIYMVHGGTSFGFSAGANAEPYSPQTTSYDYDAPIAEHGVATPKYHELRRLLQKYAKSGEDFPPEPGANKLISINPIRLRDTAPLLATLPQAVSSKTPLTFEDLDQPHGCVLYRTSLPPSEAGQLRIRDLHDYALVYLDGKQVARLDRRLQENAVGVPSRQRQQSLDLLVYAFGRVNYGPSIHDRKGISQGIDLVCGTMTIELSDYSHYRFPLDPPQLAELRFSNGGVSGPAFYRGHFQLQQLGDTFLDLRGWGCGVVWVNGHNLGRFWSIGPTQTLYTPAPFLREGDNEIIIWDLFDGSKPPVVGLEHPILDDVKK